MKKLYHRIDGKDLYHMFLTDTYWGQYVSFLSSQKLVEDLDPNEDDYLRVKLRPEVLHDFIRKNVVLTVKKARTWWHVQDMYLKRQTGGKKGERRHKRAKVRAR